jgi:hypothetical protein
VQPDYKGIVSCRQWRAMGRARCEEFAGRELWRRTIGSRLMIAHGAAKAGACSLRPSCGMRAGRGAYLYVIAKKVQGSAVDDAHAPDILVPALATGRQYACPTKSQGPRRHRIGMV